VTIVRDRFSVHITGVTRDDVAMERQAGSGRTMACCSAQAQPRPPRRVDAPNIDAFRPRDRPQDLRHWQVDQMILRNGLAALKAPAPTAGAAALSTRLRRGLNARMQAEKSTQALDPRRRFRRQRARSGQIFTAGAAATRRAGRNSSRRCAQAPAPPRETRRSTT
jgi:hypothetical protein